MDGYLIYLRCDKTNLTSDVKNNLINNNRWNLCIFQSNSNTVYVAIWRPLLKRAERSFMVGRLTGQSTAVIMVAD